MIFFGVVLVMTRLVVGWEMTLATLSNVANALGKKLKVEFVDDLAMA